MKWFKLSKKTTRRYQLQIKKAKQAALALLFIVLVLVINRLLIGLDQPKKPIVDTKQDQPLAVSVLLSYLDPALLPNSPPINQIDNFASSVSAQTYNLFPNGELVPGQDEANTKIKLIFSEKPNQDKLKQTFWLIAKINQETPITKGYLLKGNLYYTGSNLPDIIIPLEFSAKELSRSLQSIPSLAKIKEGVKTIDLRFNHPIIR
jgi:hypothetical protein